MTTPETTPQLPPRVAIIGCGEVGRCYAAALNPLVQFPLRLCDARPSPRIAELSGRLGAEFHPNPGPWLLQVDLLMSCVVGSAALDVARAALPHMASGSVFADFTTASPGDKKAAGAHAAAAGIFYADTVIMGTIAGMGLQAPLVSTGPGAARVQELMTRAGAPIRLLENGEVGSAASLKLLRSIFAKGLEALAVETLVAAEHYGMRSQLYEVLADYDAIPIRTRLENLVRTHVIHAERRMHEIEEAQHQMDQAGLPMRVTEAVHGLFENTVDALARSGVKPDPTTDEALAWLCDVARGGGTGAAPAQGTISGA